jgi:Domain of unknown function (DUF4132)
MTSRRQLDELSEARIAEGRDILDGLVARYVALRAAAEAELNRSLSDRAVRPAGKALEAFVDDEALAGLSVEQSRCLLFALAERLTASGDDDVQDGVRNYGVCAQWFHWITHRPLALLAGDVRLLAAVADPGPGIDGYEPFEYVVDMVERLLQEGAAGAAGLADAVADQVLRWNAIVYHRTPPDWVMGRGVTFDTRSLVSELRDRALELAERPPAPPPLEGPVGRDDGYGLAVIGWLGLVEDWPADVRAFLEHCVTARATRPGPRWDKLCRQRLDDMAEPAAVVRRLLNLLLTTEPVRYMTNYGERMILVGFNEQLIKGVVWAAGLLDPPWLPEMLYAVAVRCLRLCSGHVFRDTVIPGEKIPYACFRALAASGSDAALTALARIGQATSNGSAHKLLARTLEQASVRRGVSAASLLDFLIPDHGIGADGLVRVASVAGRWTISLDDHHGAVLNDSGQHAGEAEPAPAATEMLAEVRATVSAVKARLDAMFADRRELHADDFSETYVRHPVAGWLARRLVWTFNAPDAAPIHGFPQPDGQSVLTPDGVRTIPACSLVRLTHPVLLGSGDLDALKLLCDRSRIIQPLRQLWRETYTLTATERETGLYTDRYAGHVLRFGQCYGLARRRGWTGGFLSGAWDGGDSAVARRDYPSAGLRASWALAMLDDLSHEVAVDLCITERVTFSPLEDTIRAPILLAEIPAEVFSEAMRDLDLVVSVSTVANDPVWLENYSGQPVLDQYWERVAVGGLDQLLARRREILGPFCTPEAAGDRYQLTDRHLIITGSLATYRIDLATANVRIEPAGRWLSFDTRLSADQEYKHQIRGLPAVDDDEILHRILIRSAILADDEQLASRKLLKQIRG